MPSFQLSGNFWLLSPFKDYWEWLCDDISKNPEGCILSHPVDLFMYKWLKCSLTLIFLDRDWYCIPTDSVVPLHLIISNDVIAVWLCMASSSSYLFLMCVHLCTNTWNRFQLYHPLKCSGRALSVSFLFTSHPLCYGHHPGLKSFSQAVGKHAHIPVCRMDFMSPSNSCSLVRKANTLHSASATQTAIGLQDTSTSVSLTLGAEAAQSIQSFPWWYHCLP